jgi:hypothetical protein
LSGPFPGVALGSAPPRDTDVTRAVDTPAAASYDLLVSERPTSVDELDWEFLQTLERRRIQSDTIAWTVPAIAVAAQAFLLSISLGSSTEPLGRLIACIAGILILFAALRLIWKSSFGFDLYDGWINYERKRLGLRGVRTRSDLLANADALPMEEGARSRGYRQRKLRWWLVVRWRSTDAWILVLRALIALDVLIAVYAIVELAGVSPGWL